MERWDSYFLNVAKAVGGNSQCFSRKIGAIIVKDKSIISTGYNGPPRGVPTCDKRWGVDDTFIVVKPLDSEKINGKCPRKVMGHGSGQGLEYCIAGHAERNSIVNAARMGISVKGGTMYCDCAIPCTPCLIEIINAGITEIVVTSYDLYDETSAYLIKTSGIIIREYR